MSAGRVACHYERTPIREGPAGGAELIAGVADPDPRAKLVARHRHREPVSVEPARQMAEGRAVEALPIAAMDEHDRAAPRLVRLEQVDHLPLAAAVTMRGVAGAGFGPVGGGVLSPAPHDVRMLRHPGPVVVLCLVVDPAHRPRPADAAPFDPVRRLLRP